MSFFCKNRFFIQFRTLRIEFLACRPKSFGRSVKNAFHFSSGIFEVNSFFEKKVVLLNCVRTLSENFPAYLGKFGRGCQNCFLRVHTKILREIVFFQFFSSFPYIERRNFSLLPRNFGLRCHNCILLVPRNI